MGSVAYALCALTSLVCFVLLARGYKHSKTRLLLWSSLCFFFFGIQNIILFVDLVIVPEVDLAFWRTISGFLGAVILLGALIWEKK
jgi:hypothetical protein